jgi:hypothetical protein
MRACCAGSHSEWASEACVEVHVAFAMHCFTRACAISDTSAQFYQDMHETRSFCPDRYALSLCLPDVARTLAARKCGFGKAENYVVIDVQTADEMVTQCGVFFNVMRVKGAGSPAVLLTIQSAYTLNPGKQVPGRGSIGFARLVELTLQGIRPRPPR